MDTIVALSSGRPPAAIAVIRISGPAAFDVAAGLAGPLPTPRHASLRALRTEDGSLLDRALVVVFPGPASATGEDIVELHCHGGRTVVTAIEAALTERPGVRSALPGEFTRRAVMNGRLDLAQAGGLADLLDAETEAQRRAAMAASEGDVSRAIRGWLTRVAAIAAQVEASLDFAEEGDVETEADLFGRARAEAATLRDEIVAILASPPVERLRDGVRVVIAGPPNSGKSTLLNLMAEREAAIVSPYSGTTRDRVEVPMQRDGVAYVLTDTAGLTDAADPVERMGVSLAERAIDEADVLVWLGDAAPPRPALWVHSRADLPGREGLPAGRALAVRQDRRATITALWAAVGDQAAMLLPTLDQLPLKRAQRDACSNAVVALALSPNVLVAAEQLRTAGGSLGSILGIDATEAMLDSLFSRFCIGK